MQVELKRIQQEVGITFIYVTHDQEEAMTMSDRIAVMNQWPLRAARRPGEPLRAPDDALRRRASSASATCSRDPSSSAETTARRSASADGTIVLVPAAVLNGEVNVDIGVRPEKIRAAARLSAEVQAGHNEPARDDPRCLVPRGVAPSTWSRPPTAPACGLRAEHRADGPRFALRAGGRGPVVVVAGPHVRRRRAWLGAETGGAGLIRGTDWPEMLEELPSP